MQLKDFILKDSSSLADILLKAKENGFKVSTTHLRIAPTDDTMGIDSWSGYYDKKGAKIYINDIVTHNADNTPLVVTNSTESKTERGTRLQSISNNDNKIDCIEVVGNIYK